MASSIWESRHSFLGNSGANASAPLTNSCVQAVLLPELVDLGSKVEKMEAVRPNEHNVAAIAVLAGCCQKINNILKDSSLDELLDENGNPSFKLG